MTAASRLAGSESGFRVGVLEEHPQVGSPVNCSGVLGTEVFERFDLPSSLIRHTLSEVEFVTPRGRRFWFDAGRPLAHVVLRSELDSFLGRRAVEAGAEVLVHHRAVGIDTHQEGVDVTVTVSVGEAASSRSFTSDAVILSTGGGMPLLRKLRMDAFPQRLLGVQAEVPMDAKHVEVVFGRAWAPEGFAWIVPIGDGVAKVGLLCERNGPQTLRRFLERPDVARRLHGEPGPIRCSVLPIGFLERSYLDRVLIVGEAAGHIKPTTCGGIYYGMLAAEIAADTLATGLAACRLDAESLASYEAKWRDLLEPEIEAGLKLRQSFKLIGDWGIERLVSLAGFRTVTRIIEEHADFDWHRNLIHAVFRDSTLGRILTMGLLDSADARTRRGPALRELSTV